MTEGHFEVIQPKYIIQNSILDKKMIQGHMAHDMGHVWPQGLWKNGREVKYMTNDFNEEWSHRVRLKWPQRRPRDTTKSALNGSFKMAYQPIPKLGSCSNSGSGTFFSLSWQVLEAAYRLTDWSFIRKSGRQLPMSTQKKRFSESKILTALHFWRRNEPYETVW